ncbi:hypothetical protein [Psychroserpens burtonensis]|uniref:hypothetical protein n=1 Tax=Psychroserpens burtonensis TaxID=49278 RepID=UPI000418B246|nr:hypothetical protein [Psychroserpens burtonensis]
MQIDFGQGLLTTVINNYVLRATTINVYYSGASERIYNASITYKDGSQVITRGKIYFKQTANEGMSRLSPSCVIADTKTKNVPIIFAEEEYQGYNSDNPRIIPQAEYRVFYGDNQNASNLKLEKPLIILDGFDPGDKRQIQDCDCEDDIDCASDNITNGVFDSEEHKSIAEFQAYKDEDNLDANLLTKLRNQNYDVIVVNHPTYTTTNLDTGQDVEIDGGAYYIESNAMVLVALIKKVNQELVDNGVTDPIEAIVGPSMGGQISRYALSYMEKKFEETGDPEWKHNVKLWISVDSPHLGANIPLGVQSLVYRLGEELDNEDAKRFYDDELGSPAAKQQLIELFRDPINSSTTNQDNLNGRVAAQGYPSDDGSLFYRTYYNNLESNGLSGSHGYPQNLRKIAVVNGSLSGNKIVATPEGNVFDSYANSGQDVLSLDAFSRICIPLIVGSYCFDVRLARLGTQFMPNYANGHQEISFYKKGGDDWKRFYSNNINSRGNMDNVPGGF